MPGIREQLLRALEDDDVARSGALVQGTDDVSTALRFGASLARAMGAEKEAALLQAEADGYQESSGQPPDARSVLAFASPFPVRALDLGLLDPEEVFVVNREKFAQVRFPIVQPAGELERLMLQLTEGGVFSMRVPASELPCRAAEVDPESEIFLYILPRELQRLVDRARRMAFTAIVDRVAAAAADSG